jgi:hypothetical protein
MHPIYLANEGTTAVIVMAVALFIAFGMVIALGAYVIYCDRLNRAGETQVPAVESPSLSPAVETGEPAARPRRRRPEPPSEH